MSDLENKNILTNLVTKVFRNDSKKIWIVVILIAIVLISWASYKTVSTIIESANRTASEQNLAIAIKAKAELKAVVDKQNQTADDLARLANILKEKEVLAEENKKITEQNNKILEQVINKITDIDNKDVTYQETDSDKLKSKIIIDSIWEVYEGEKNVK